MTSPQSFDRPLLECANRHLQLLSRALGGVGVCLAVNDLFSPHLLLPFLHYSPLHNRRNFMLRRPTIIMTFDMLVFLSARTIKEIQRPLSVTSDEGGARSYSKFQPSLAASVFTFAHVIKSQVAIHATVLSPSKSMPFDHSPAAPRRC